MNKPAYIRTGNQVRYCGELYKITDDDGGDFDCRLENIGGWVSWTEVSEGITIKVPSKTERKKIAAEIKKTYNSLMEQLKGLEAKGMQFDVYINGDDLGDDCNSCEISYQPPQPPMERY